MSVYVESGIELDLSRALAHEKHDVVNRVFGGVDFIIETGSEALWLEIKSWARNVIPPHRRGGQRRSYLVKMKNKEFPNELRGKFLGTCSFLTLTGAPPSGKITVRDKQFAFMFLLVGTLDRNLPILSPMEGR